MKHTVLFLLGGGAYVGVELLWRGRSHSSMFLAGGACFLLLGALQKRASRFHPSLRGFAGAGIVTAVELLTGLLVNRSYAVWDYRRMPLHFGGQICLPFFFLWVPLSLCAMGLYHITDKWLSANLPQGKAWSSRPPCRPCGRKSKGR